MAVPTLELLVIEAVPKTVTFQIKETLLGDGYAQVASVGKGYSLTNYNITTDYMPLPVSLELKEKLANWRGVQAFYWTPNPGIVPAKLFTCKEWGINLATSNSRQLTATFNEVIK
jgi:phage-related protein